MSNDAAEDGESPDDLHGLGPCGMCDHDPACGFASLTRGDGPTVWYCHADDHDCYYLIGASSDPLRLVTHHEFAADNGGPT